MQAQNGATTPLAICAITDAIGEWIDSLHKACKAPGKS
jgi:hypothetical protein